MNNNVTKFEDLQVWKEGMRLVVDIYKNLKTCNDYGIRYELQKDAATIPFTIARGFEKHSGSEFIQSLHDADGFCAKLRRNINRKIKTGMIDKSKGNELSEQTRKLSLMLRNMIKENKNRFSNSNHIHGIPVSCF